MKRFGEAATRLAGAMGVTFGWRAGEFWRATPAELAALVRALAGPTPEGVTRDELARMR